MGLDRRVVVALSIIAVILAPALILRAFCAGRSCDEPEPGSAKVPFCSLPEDQRRAIVAGFREGRSPDVLAVADAVADTQVPILFFGEGFGSVDLPAGLTLDRIAPTLAQAIGFHRPHPEVRSGLAIEEGPSDTGARLVLIVAVKGIGGPGFDTRFWTELPSLGSDTAVIGGGSTGSLPVDPTAALTTIGTGGLPYQHGITGTLVRNDSGELVEAWSDEAPVSVIATLADDFDDRTHQQAKIALVGRSPLDRGLVAGNWYPNGDRDEIRYARGVNAQIDAVRDILSSGYGKDAVPDVVAVALEGPQPRVDMAIVRLLDLAKQASNDRLVGVIAGTGASENQSVNVAAVERAIPGRRPLLEAAAAGGFFIDQNALTESGRTEDEVVDAIKKTGLFADAFASITVSFARYC